MCGGTPTTANSAVCRGGLSPRVRGNLAAWMAAVLADRSIPACAGEPRKGRSLAPSSSVYPRVCGGTVRLIVQAGDCLGLSPRVRGNPGRIQPQCCGRRSIPACAGEPRKNPATMLRSSVYPRVCGGTWVRGWRTVRGVGLSPRVRGNRPDEALVIAQVRSIPACAGEPSRHTSQRTVTKVYPRVCGGTEPTRLRHSKSRGLSPRVRGNPR